MWNPVPWFINGGDHSPEVARLLAYAATGGAEGVIEPTDCKVTAKPVPGQAVLVNTGAATIPNRAAGAGRQSYLAQQEEAEEVLMTPTGSGGSRTDLIIARIEDPDYFGNDEERVGPFIFTRVVEGVSSSVKRVQEVAGHANDSAVTLARVTRPANTGTVLPAHITDLRRISQTRSEPKIFMGSPDIGSSNGVIGVPLPAYGGYFTRDVDIPDWATHFSAVASIAGLQAVGPSLGQFRMVLGADADPNKVVGTPTVFDVNAVSASDPARFSTMSAIGSTIPAALRGTRQRLALTGGTNSAATPVKFDTSSVVVVQVEFHMDVV